MRLPNLFKELRATQENWEHLSLYPPISVALTLHQRRIIWIYIYTNTHIHILMLYNLKRGHEFEGKL